MTERDIIRARLLKKEQEIEQLEDKIRSARIYVQALQDILRLVEEDPDPSSVAGSALRPGSSVAKARDEILRRGAPVHIGDLLSALGKDASRESRSSLTSSLAAYVRRGEIFTRPAPNTFGLIELQHEPVAPGPVEPPKGFGASPEPPPPPSRSPDLDDEIPF